MKVSDCTIFAEEICAVKMKTFADTVVKFRCIGVLRYGLQRAEVVASMEIINPSLRTLVPVVPGSVGVLLCGRIVRRPKCWSEEFPFAPVPVHAAQQGGSKKIRVVHLNAKRRPGIAEPGRGTIPGPVKLVQDIFGGTHGHIQAS